MRRWRSTASIRTATASTSPGELEPLTRENLDSLKDYDYFTYMRFDGKKQAMGDARRMPARSIPTTSCSFTSRCRS